MPAHKKITVEYINRKKPPHSRLTAIQIIEPKVEKSGKVRPCVLCICKCGNHHTGTAHSVISGGTISCNCAKKRIHQTHGLKKHPLYSVWANMRGRCYYDKDDSFKYYGGRGIKVCDEWLCDFKSFYDWAITNGYKKGLQIDRKNNNGNYTPENCRFVTCLTNNQNKRNVHIIEYMGLKLSVTDWASRTGISRHAILQRFKKGWSLDTVFSTKNLQSNFRGKNRHLNTY